MGQPSAEMRKQLDHWRVEAIGPVLLTESSELMAGIRQGTPVMVKIATVEEEVRGSHLLKWWGGRGAAPVLEREGSAMLMERATGPRLCHGKPR